MFLMYLLKDVNDTLSSQPQNLEIMATTLYLGSKMQTSIFHLVEFASLTSSFLSLCNLHSSPIAARLLITSIQNCIWKQRNIHIPSIGSASITFGQDPVDYEIRENNGVVLEKDALQLTETSVQKYLHTCISDD